MNRLTTSTLVLAASLALQGCASTTLNGDPVPGSPTGQDVAKAIVGLVIVGGLLYAASKASGDGPDERFVTTCGGGTCTTDVYRN